MGVGRLLNVEDFIRQAEKAIANGIATLDSSAKVPKNQISLTATDVGAVGTESDPTVPALAKTLSTNNAVLAAINAATGTIDGAKIPAQTWASVTGKPTDLAGFGITDAQPLGNELTAIQALVDTPGFIKKTGNGAYSIDTATYLTAESDPTVATFTKGLISSDAVLTAVNAASGTISASRLPSYVDDVLNFSALVNFPITGETGKIYVAEDSNKTYRWTGSVYVEISSAATADTAVKLATPRTIATTGDAAYSVSFDGSANVSASITLATVNSNVGSFGSATATPVITVDAKGRITAISAVTTAPSWASISSKPTTLAGFGITDAQPLGNELTALQALADTVGFMRKTGNGAYSIDTASYLPLTGGTISGNVNLSATTPSTSPTTGASVVAGGQGISGDQHIGGFTSLGGVASGHPATKKKLIEGTTPATQGASISIAHGLTASKILSISLIINLGGGVLGYWVPQNYDAGAVYDCSWSTDLTLLYVHTKANASASALSQTFRAVIEYIA